MVDTILASGFPLAVRWGVDLCLIYNDGYKRILGEKHPRALGVPFREAWPEVQERLAPLHAAIIDGSSIGFFSDDLLLKIKREKDRWEEAHFAISYSPVPDATVSSGVGGVLVTAIEITQRIKTEQDLRESKQRLDLALSVGHGVGTWDWDVVHDRVVADERFARRYGVDPERAKEGAPIAEFFGGIHPDDVARVQAEVADGMKSGNLFVSEYRLPQSNGADRWVVAQGRCTLSPQGNPLRFSGISFDITDRKAAEIRREALVKLADCIRDLDKASDLAFAASTILGETLNVSRVSYGTIDHDAETLTVDRDWLAPGVETLAGTLKLRDYGSFIDSLKRGEFIVIGNVDHDPRTVSAAKALRARSAGAFVNVPVIERGRLVAVFFLNNAETHEWSNDEVSLIQEIAERTRTATERLNAAAALRQANETLEARIAERTKELVQASEALRQAQKMEAVGQLTGGVAHDFNNLLTIIRSATDFLRRRELPEERRRRYIDAISDTVDRAAKLTGQLLAFARRQPLSPEVFNVGEQVDAIIQLMRPLVGGRIKIDADLCNPACFATADIAQFETALINFAINGRDAMDGEGVLTLKVEGTEQIPPMRGRPIQRGSYIAVSVTDTGMGIPEDKLEEIFEPFYTTKGVGKGTGLGLSQAFGFAKQSGGEINVRSELNKGSVFTLYLPRSEAPDQSKTPSTSVFEIDPSESGYRVLVVEDNDGVAQFTTELLEDLGYVVERVENAKAALATLAEDEFAFDLVFSDIVMPGMNGIELGRTIRERFPGLPVILTSGYSDVLSQNGHYGFDLIQKPYSVEALSRVVKKTIVERRPRSV